MDLFLTREDPRAKIQGSRDPLGVQPIWASFGRQVVTNLTTVTTSVRGFTILMLGRYLVERLIDKGKARPQDALSVFLRVEQIGAYARYLGHEVEGDIRGIERVKRFIAENGRSVPIGDSPSAFILSDQKTYGLWGLYSVAARVSGIIAEGPVGLTPRARDFVENAYWPRLGGVEQALFGLAARNGTLDTGKRSPLLNAVASILPERFSRDEVVFYEDTLRDAAQANGQQSHRHQRALAGLLEKHTDLSSPIGRLEVLHLAVLARDKDEVLSRCLTRIARLEALLAPAEALFDYLLARNGQTPADVARILAREWGRSVPNLQRDDLLELLPAVRAGEGTEKADILERCDSCLADGDYEDAILALLDWNAHVMRARSAAPWVRLSSGKLDVRYRGQESILPDRGELPVLWRNSYFVNALKEITRQLGQGAR